MGSSTADNPLPVLLLSFRARMQKDGVLVEWQSASEYLNQGYEIFRGEDNPDNLVKIASYVNNPDLAGSGYSSTSRHYQYKDKTAHFGHTYYYYLDAVDFDGTRSRYGPVVLTIDRPIVSEQPHSAIGQFVLYQNYPNPFNPQTSIRFQIPSSGNTSLQTGVVELLIYDVHGRLVRHLLRQSAAPGDYEIRWDGKDDQGNIVPGGVYFYVLKNGLLKLTRKMILMR